MNEDIALSSRKSNRIVAIDIMRGFFLIVILINHIELYPSFFDFFTGRGRLLVSAAEGFFFMSGLLVGMVYKRRIAYGMKFIFKKMWRRAAELYLASIFFTLLFTAAAIYLKHPNIKDGLPDVISWPNILKETVLLRYGFGWADFLDRFAILMFLAPFGFYLLVKGKWWLLLAASVLVWCFRGNGFTSSWQIIFGGGMIVGFYWQQLQDWYSGIKRENQRRIKLSLIVFTAITFIFSYASVYLLSKLNQNLLGDPWIMPMWLQSFTNHWNSFNEFVWLYAQKWTMGPVRIVLFMAWFIVMYIFVNRYHRLINRLTRHKIELLGRNSLFVYIAHAFIVFAFKLFIPPHTSIWGNFIITGAALALLIILTQFYSKIQQNKPSKNQASLKKTKGSKLLPDWLSI